MKMVAISLYRGNLHRVPDVPRRWLMPKPKISLKDFKSLLARRSKAVSSLRASAVIATTANPNPNSHFNEHNEAPANNGSSVPIQSEPVKVGNDGEGPSRRDEVQKDSEAVGDSSKKLGNGSGSFIDTKIDVLGKASEPADAGVNSTENRTELVSFGPFSHLLYS